MRLGFVLGLFLLPHLCLASVQITEIAWMGTLDSPNHEWIEVYNSGAAQNVDGWILHDANNLTIELLGVLPANQYAVLERTSDLSASGAAFLLYTGALTNVGATLVLRNAAGEVVDQVAGGDNWELIGGSNETKDTAQRVTSTWRTAPATPGDAPTVSSTETDSTELIVETKHESEPTKLDTTGTNMTVSGSSNIAVSRTSSPKQSLTVSGSSLQLAITAPNSIHVGQAATFIATPSGVGKTIANSLVYNWSLGNGEQKSGKEISYTFTHPGQYVVVVSGVYKQQTQFTRQTVTVLPVELSISKAPDGPTFTIHNTSDHEIDIGGYTFAGRYEHQFPTHTILLPQSAVRIPIKLAGTIPTAVALYDETDLAVAVLLPELWIPTVTRLAEPIPTNQLVMQNEVKITVVPPVTPVGEDFGFVSDILPAPAAPPKDHIIPPVELTPQIATVATIPGTPLAANWPLYALVLVLFLSTIGIYLVPQKKDNPPWV
jgi:hypothetical protein